MSDSPDWLSDLDLLLCDVSDGALDDLKLKQLDEILAGDSEALAHYVDYIDLFATLTRQPAIWAKENYQWQGTTSEFDSLVARPAATIAAPFSSVHHRPSPGIPSFLSIPIHGTIGYFSQGLPLAYLLATVITGLGLLVGSLIHVSHPEQVARESFSPALVVQPKVELVGRITGMVDCKCQEGSRFKVQGSESGNCQSEIISQKSLVALGDKFTLASGLMEITYDTGAKVILQGPVTYEVESNGGYLSLGRLTGKLEKGSGVRGQGSEAANHKAEIRNHKSSLSTIHYPLFTIRTPTATVTDLGTEFGVEVTQDGATESRVFAGAIKIAPVSNLDGSAKEQIVPVGSAVRVDGNGRQVTVMQLRERQFVRALPSQMATASAAADAYAELVLSMQPFAYYRMERPKDPKEPNLIFDSAPGGHHGTLHLGNEYGGDPWWKGRFGDSIYLRGSDAAGDYIEVPDYPGTNTDQLSVSVWVHPMSVHAFDLIVCDVPIADADAGYQFLLGVDSRLRLLGASAQRDKEVRWLAEEDKGADKPLLHYQWRHVALVVDGTAIRLYRDGMEVSKLSCQGVLRNPSHSFFIGGRCLTRSGRPMPMNLWHGRIDELAVFHHALSGEQIRRLFVGCRKEIDNISTKLATP